MLNRLVLPQLVYEDLTRHSITEDNYWGLNEVQEGGIAAPLSSQVGHFIIGTHHRSSMTFPWWIHADYSWFSCPSCAWEWFQDEFHQLPRDQGEADQSIDAWVFLFVILEDRTFAILHSLGSSPSCHSHSRIIKRGLTVTSTSSLSTHRWIPLGDGMATIDEHPNCWCIPWHYPEQKWVWDVLCASIDTSTGIAG